MHVWLHVVDYIERTGPMWTYWCWVMERYCGHLTRSIASKKHPYGSLNRRVLDLGTLGNICDMYNLATVLPSISLMREPNPDNVFFSPNHANIELLNPRRQLDLTSDAALKAFHARIVVHLATQWGCTTGSIKHHVPTLVTQHGRLRILPGRDTVRACQAYRGDRMGLRDATYLQYELLVDRLAHRRNAPVDLQPHQFFGRLHRVISFTIQSTPTNKFPIPSESPTTFILMDIEPSNTTEDTHGFHEYTTSRAHEVVNGRQARALVGRIHDRGKWVFVRRSSGTENIIYGEEDGANVVDSE